MWNERARERFEHADLQVFGKVRRLIRRGWMVGQEDLASAVQRAAGRRRLQSARRVWENSSSNSSCHAVCGTACGLGGPAGDKTPPTLNRRSRCRIAPRAMPACLPACHLETGTDDCLVYGRVDAGGQTAERMDVRRTLVGLRGQARACRSIIGPLARGQQWPRQRLLKQGRDSQKRKTLRLRACNQSKTNLIIRAERGSKKKNQSNKGITRRKKKKQQKPAQQGKASARRDWLGKRHSGTKQMLVVERNTKGMKRKEDDGENMCDRTTPDRNAPSQHATPWQKIRRKKKKKKKKEKRKKRKEKDKSPELSQRGRSHLGGLCRDICVVPFPLKTP
ncbi:hypothetical protein IWX50DRAFT_616248 [Phyllosticta citricarpa]|uniref:Uncharacterized protein n=1 Tax=Phyllosticta citricarpa TaxID=55181 RepID=A0ABR1MLP3_9PEZI